MTMPLEVCFKICCLLTEVKKSFIFSLPLWLSFTLQNDFKDPISCISPCCLLQNRKLSSRWVCWICFTSVVLAELSFTQLSLTAGSFDPGRAPPLHSCLCPLFIQEAPGVQTLSGSSESGLAPTRPQPHPDRSCPDG